MVTKTSGDIEQEFLNNLKTATGKNLKSWLAQIDGFGSKKRDEIIKWLKEKNEFGHMNASLLAGIYLNGGKAVYGNTDDLLDGSLDG